MTDFVASLGPGFLAHRLRRASEAILEATTQVLRREGFAGPPRAVSMLLLLREQGPLGITELAYRLQLSHPMVIKLTRALADERLIADAADPRDNRRRLVALTETGRAQTAVAERVADAVGRIVTEQGGALLTALDAFTAELATDPLEGRITAALDTPVATEGGKQ